VKSPASGQKLLPLLLIGGLVSFLLGPLLLWGRRPSAALLGRIPGWKKIWPPL
jgi:hypothetical protein